MIEKSLENLEPQIEELLQQGLPENARTWLGMMGFLIVVDLHGEVLRVEGAQESFDDEDNE
jgi:ABC-type microcin C transport system permease subunit YejE